MMKGTIKSAQIILSVIALVMGYKTSFADAGTMTFANMISSSSVIVLGKVKAVHIFSPVPSYPIKIAEVEVLETLKAEKKSKTIYYWATPGRADDVANATVGEVAIFMLRPDRKMNEYPKSWKSAIPKLKSLVGNQSPYKLIHQGRGRLGLVVLEGQQYVMGCKTECDTQFPEKMPMRTHPDPKYSFIGLFNLKDVLDSIRNNSN